MKPILRDAAPFLSRALACLLVACSLSQAQAAEPAPASQVTEGFVNAPIAEVWRLFTTSEGFKTTGAEQAEVDLRVGGLIRAHYDPKGALGDPETVVNEILAYEPQRMLALRIKQPPASFAYRDAVAGTWTVIYFTPSGEDMTHVRIVGLGYRDDAQSQAMRQFFEKGNRATLDHIAQRYWPKCKLCLQEEAAAQSGN
ncbi:MAG TPA: SRPBCC domain-containing protein [Povalibacter sp.]|nr:SRPBCC domain-containing protein [Povalibacter sp.]